MKMTFEQIIASGLIIFLGWIVWSCCSGLTIGEKFLCELGMLVLVALFAVGSKCVSIPVRIVK